MGSYALPAPLHLLGSRAWGGRGSQALRVLRAPQPDSAVCSSLPVASLRGRGQSPGGSCLGSASPAGRVCTHPGGPVRGPPSSGAS